MKKYYFFVLSFLCGLLFNALLYAQLLNSSFETWDTVGDPNEWITNNLQGLAIGITSSTDAYDGTLSAKLEVTNFSGFPHAANIQSFSGSAYGHPITEKYGSVTGYYKFFPTGGAEFLITVTVHAAQTQLIGVGGLSSTDPVSDWTMFDIPIDYSLGTENAASIVVSISVVASTESDLAAIGAYALVDNIGLGNPTGVDIGTGVPTEYVLNQNYPNPFNPTTTIQYEIPQVRNVETTGPVGSNVSLRIYDILGHEIKTLVNEYQSPGTYEIEFNAANLESGIYFYRLQSGNFNAVKKLILLK